MMTAISPATSGVTLPALLGPFIAIQYSQMPVIRLQLEFWAAISVTKLNPSDDHRHRER
jgi:hypothetical protein